MRLRWSPRASADLVRLAEFLRPKSRAAAARIVRMLMAGPRRLVDYPRSGEQVEGAGEVELRRLLVDAYEIQYEVRANEIVVARIFHTREER
jgi:plasmid stabilization system protein ParE